MNHYKKTFCIQDAVGNNEFSYEQRDTKKIYVPSLEVGYYQHVKQGNLPAFVEIDEYGEEKICYGLKNFIQSGKVIIFDNHNHSYYFYKNFLRENHLASMAFVHVDQHKDMREPSLSLVQFHEAMNEEDYCRNFLRKISYVEQSSSNTADYLTNDKQKRIPTSDDFAENHQYSDECNGLSILNVYEDYLLNKYKQGNFSIQDIRKKYDILGHTLNSGSSNIDDEEIYDFLYTNLHLNVGNFIRPLLDEKRISDLYIVDSEYRMDEFDLSLIPEPFALDLDLDFFSEEMDYIPWEKKILFVRKLAEKADLILVAFSPYFIPFERAKKALFEIFEDQNF